ncbi:expressed unknown protein [Seminavis robusta]|uniref:Tetratricopeptide repeat protein n=1 Tax=Seminavis robusta TaxID=568900 RepID=A0A9N8HIN0_9STRA|nr:expressed unknown protein [Seminavis robusta]|eukprot:Sro605_g174330.1 n/a (405) ;mRNA; r:35032-36345
MKYYEDAMEILRTFHNKHQQHPISSNCYYSDCYIGKGRTLLNMSTKTNNTTDQTHNNDNDKLLQEAFENLQHAWKTLKWNFGGGASQKTSTAIQTNCSAGDALYLMGHAQMLRANRIKKDDTMRIILLQEALTHWKYALQKHNEEQTIEHEKVIETSRAIGMAYTRLQEPDMALPYLEDCLQIARSLREDDEQRIQLAWTFIALGDCYTSSSPEKTQTNNDQALEAYQEALSVVLPKEEEQRQMLLMLELDAMVALGDFHCKAGDETQALYYYQEVPFKLSPKFHLIVRVKQAILLFRKGEISSALACFEEYLEQCQEEANEDEAYFVALFSTGICYYLEERDKAKADGYYWKAIQVATRNQLFDDDPMSSKALKSLESKLKRSKRGSMLGQTIASWVAGRDTA